MLVATAIAVPDSVAPTTRDLSIAIDANGDMVWFEANETRFVGTIVSGEGKQLKVIRFAPRGSGPGEVRSPWFVKFGTYGILAFEPVGRRLMCFTRAGVLLTDKFASYVVGLTSTGGLSMTFDRVSRLSAFTPDMASTRTLSSDRDTVWLRLAQRYQANDGAEPFASAMVGDNVYLSATTSAAMYKMTANGVAKSFGADVRPRVRTGAEVDAYLKLSTRPIVGPKGERIVPEVSPNARRRVSEEHVRQVSPITGLQVDGEGRLWRVRSTATGAFADIFADTTLIGSIKLACAPLPRGVSVAGRWLLLACPDNREDSDTDVVLRRFRF